MKSRLLIVLLLITGVCTFSSSPSAFACACVDSTVQQRIDYADVIFSGKLYPNIWEHTDHYIAGNFAVKKIWKGAEEFPSIITGDVAVVTGVDSGNCGVKFVPNNDYLIFAKIDGDVLKTNSCSGSWFLDGREDDVAVLEEYGSTHAFIDAREVKGSTVECGGAGFTSKEECESAKLFREVILPMLISFPIIGVSVFVIWRKKQ